MTTPLLARRGAIGGGSQAVASFDSVTTPPAFANGSLSFTHTASATGASKGYLVVVAYSTLGTPTCAIGGVSAASIGTASGVFVFGAAQGTVAANATFAVVITNTGNNIVGGSVLYGGVNQASPTDTTQADSSTPTTAISSAAKGNIVAAVGFLTSATAGTSPTCTLSQGSGTLASRWSTSQAPSNHWDVGLSDSAEAVVENVSFAWSAALANIQGLFTFVVKAG